MGTRNLFVVKKDGETKISEYCQWDGYPTGQGTPLLTALSYIKQGGDWEKFLKKLDRVCLTVVPWDNAGYYTGAPASSKFPDIAEKINALRFDHKCERSYFECGLELIKQGDLSLEDYEEYIMATRDSGPADIVCALMLRPTAGITTWAVQEMFECDHIGGDITSDIEALYVLDCDSEKVQIDWHGVVREYDLNNLPDDINQEMELFEAEGYN